VTPTLDRDSEVAFRAMKADRDPKRCPASRKVRSAAKRGEVCGWYWPVALPVPKPSDLVFHYCALPFDHVGDHACQDGATRPKPSFYG
jgi:hypothetical protein